MTTYVALLRAVNVGGRNMVPMEALRALLTELGFSDSRSLLQSGNLIFRTEAKPTGALEALLEVETERRLGLQTRFFVRTDKEWRTVVSKNPFPREARDDPGHLHVMFLKTAPQSRQVTALQSAITGSELVRAHGSHAYLVYPTGIGSSRLTNAIIERHLGTSGTTRNWNTVLKLASLVSS